MEEHHTSLRGKYKRAFLPKHNKAIEKWLNEFATSSQKQTFRNTIKQIHEFNVEGSPTNRDNQSSRNARVLYSQYAEDIVVPEFAKRCLQWLMTADEQSQNHFRDVMCAVRGAIKYYTPESQTATAFPQQEELNRVLRVERPDVQTFQSHKSAIHQRVRETGQGEALAASLGHHNGAVLDPIKISAEALATTSQRHTVGGRATRHGANREYSAFKSYANAEKGLVVPWSTLKQYQSTQKTTNMLQFQIANRSKVVPLGSEELGQRKALLYLPPFTASTGVLVPSLAQRE